jgi:hypothetical protein
MLQVIARYPVLVDGRVLSFVAAVALAVVSIVTSGDVASATVNINGRGGGGYRWPVRSLLFVRRVGADRRSVMRYAPAMAQQLVVLHQRDHLARAERSRLVTQTRPTRHSFRKEIPMPTLTNMKLLALSFPLNPKAVTAATAAVALVAGLLLGPDSASAHFNIGTRGGR